MSRSLERGGAERQLVQLANGLAARGHGVGVALFYSGGGLEADLAGVEIVRLGKRGRWDVLPFVAGFLSRARRFRPDILYTFLGTPNILGAALKPLLRPARIVWGVRASDMDYSRYDWAVAASASAEAFFSRFADRIIANSEAGMEHAISRGMPREKFAVIPNGIDMEVFRPDRALGAPLRLEWGCRQGDVLVGLPARIDPMKDQENFLRAARMAADRYPGLRFVCIGGGAAGLQEQLRSLAADLGLGERLVWAGEREDMPAVYNALDICCLSSITEGFPNVLGEAMACGVSCVATDVGDAALVVGETGVVVPAGDPAALARGIEGLLARRAADPEGLGRAARGSIEAEFGVERMIEATEAVLLRCAGRAGGRS